MLSSDRALRDLPSGDIAGSPKPCRRLTPPHRSHKVRDMRKMPRHISEVDAKRMEKAQDRRIQCSLIAATLLSPAVGELVAFLLELV